MIHEHRDRSCSKQKRLILFLLHKGRNNTSELDNHTNTKFKLSKLNGGSNHFLFQWNDYITLKHDAGCTGIWALIYTMCCMHRLKKSPYSIMAWATRFCDAYLRNVAILSLIEAGIANLLPYCFFIQTSETWMHMISYT